NRSSFQPQLTTLTYKYGVKNTVDPFTGEESLGEPYWFALYSTSTGQLAGITDLMVPTLNGIESRNWGYIAKGTSYTPEEWQRTWATDLTIGNYVNEKYAFYVGGSLSSFEAFADGISFLGRESAPLITTIVDEEHVHYTVYVYVTDYDGAELANANVTVYNGSTYVDSKVTNSTGYARFYLEPGEYNFNATWSGNTSYEIYTNSTTATITSDDTVNLVFSEITTLWCQTKYTSGQPIQNAYINLTLSSTGQLVDSSHVNLTGWAEFHIKRSSVIGNYSIKAFYDDGTQFATSYLNISIDSRSDSPLYFDEAIGTNIFTYIVFNTTTSFNVTWGTNVTLTIWWRDQDGTNLSTTAVGGSLNWTLYYINGTLAYGPENLEPQGSDPNIHYIANVPSSLLYGGMTYQIYVNASAPSTSYLPAANQTVVFVQSATFSVTVTPLSGTYYWKHSDIPLWVNVTNNELGVPVTSANVTFSITGTSVSGQLLHSSPSGNYTYTIPASDVEAYLMAATYGLRFTVSSTNYTTYTVDTQLMITPAQAELLVSSIVEGYYGDVLTVSVLYRDRVDRTPIYTGTVSYFVWRQDISGSLVSSGSGNWTGSFDSTLLRPGIYVFRVAAQSPNYEICVDFVPLHIMEIPVEVKGENLLSSPVNEYLLISVQLNDTHNNEPVTGATVNYSVYTSGGSPIVSGSLTDANNGTYYTWLYLSSQITPPGNYIIEVSATKENYSSSAKVIQLAIQGIPTVLSPSTSYLSSLNNPAVFFLGNYGQTENGITIPAIFIFRYVDSEGSPIPNATVSAGGWPLISLGNGNYALIIPTYGLAPSAYPIVVSASANLYESQQSLFLLQVKERTVLIPFINIRVPFTIFLVVVLAVAIPVSAMAGYSYVKRARIPAIIKRIDELILAINRGQKIDAKPIPRETVISKVLTYETSLIGVEPRVKEYVSIELTDRLIPLLTEIGMTENEALTLIKELQKASPAQREKLLESLSVPSETSTTIMQTIEEEEERKAKTKIEIKKTNETETPEEPQEELQEEPQEEPVKSSQEQRKKETKK
ncbi:MAG: carboxypeptidase-like regulatory domain-containing protein, partial [Candidatus Freyarchaeota archaeon]